VKKRINNNSRAAAPPRRAFIYHDLNLLSWTSEIYYYVAYIFVYTVWPNAFAFGRLLNYSMYFLLKSLNKLAEALTSFSVALDNIDFMEVSSIKTI
jgi:hypothetical protein